jgi:hypothetical protein
MEINTVQIQAELQELAGQNMKVKVKLNKKQVRACSSRETDKGITVSFNPTRIRSPQKLEGYLNDLRQDVIWQS